MNIYLFSYEFYNEDRSDLIDGGLASEYFKWAKQLKIMGHDVTIVSTSNNRFSKTTYEGIKIIELVPNLYMRKLNQLICKLFCKHKDNIYIQGIKTFLFFENLKKHIDIVQFSSVVPVGNLKFIPNCIRIASYTKNYNEAYDISGNEKIIDQEEKMFKEHNFIFGPSQCIADLIKEDLQIKKDIKIIETPYINHERSYNESYYQKIKDKNYILFFGTLGRLKGCFDLGEIIYNILDSNKEIYFVFVGKQVPWKELYPIDFLKEKAKEHAKRIIYFDKLSHKYLFPIISGANFCLMPSKTENFSNTCLEAMALRKIVLGSSPFFDQIIEDGKNGFLCKASDPQSIKKKIFQILDLSKEKRRSIENFAYQRILQCNIVDKTKELVEYYKDVIKKFKRV